MGQSGSWSKLCPEIGGQWTGTRRSVCSVEIFFSRIPLWITDRQHSCVLRRAYRRWGSFTGIFHPKHTFFWWRSIGKFKVRNRKLIAISHYWQVIDSMHFCFSFSKNFASLRSPFLKFSFSKYVSHEFFSFLAALKKFLWIIVSFRDS